MTFPSVAQIPRDQRGYMLYCFYLSVALGRSEPPTLGLHLHPERDSNPDRLGLTPKCRLLRNLVCLEKELHRR